jgi:hypothetical protein
MWLVNTKTLELVSFEPNKIPPYAILSHTWGDAELSFQDMSRKREDIGHKSGYEKLVGVCRQASNDGHAWVWVDTCCIDKSSSAELSEAINSMLSWYEHATVCYVYLSDVPDKRFEDSHWFTRGWTLQVSICNKISAVLWLILVSRNCSRRPISSSTTGTGDFSETNSA